MSSVHHIPGVIIKKPSPWRDGIINLFALEITGCPHYLVVAPAFEVSWRVGSFLSRW
jgi:hypothetical protein